jgi:hypothetical protein
LAALVAVTGLLAVVAAAAAGGGGNVREELIGYQEVPAVSTTGHGSLRATVRSDRIEYRLRYSDLESPAQQAHIHLGDDHTNGGISVFFCSNLGNGPAGTEPCPPGTDGADEVSGEFTAADVIGPSGQGITAGEFDELVRAIRAGVTYANVHSTQFPGGEIRGNIDRDRDD